jgi:hypothetical protein
MSSRLSPCYSCSQMRIKMTQLLVERCKQARPVYAAAIASRNMDQVEAALAAGANVGFKTVEVSGTDTHGTSLHATIIALQLTLIVSRFLSCVSIIVASA